ncbi:MAG: hypothetical protein FD126_714 [Elusimicrobia bacterium]|nr:MAG: hypothetical protein FD126_714 [Elusimicrobiota bacterium]
MSMEGVFADASRHRGDFPPSRFLKQPLERWTRAYGTGRGQHYRRQYDAFIFSHPP